MEKTQILVAGIESFDSTKLKHTETQLKNPLPDKDGKNVILLKIIIRRVTDKFSLKYFLFLTKVCPNSFSEFYFVEKDFIDHLLFDFIICN